MTIWQGQPTGDRPEYVCIQETTIGAMDATITGAGWMIKSGLRKKFYGVQDQTNADYLVKNKPLPVRLAHGEETTFYLPVHRQGCQAWGWQIHKRRRSKCAKTGRKIITASSATQLLATYANFGFQLPAIRK